MSDPPHTDSPPLNYFYMYIYERTILQVVHRSISFLLPSLIRPSNYIVPVKIYMELSKPNMLPHAAAITPRALICKPCKEPRNRFQAWRADYDNPILRTGPPG